MQNRILLCWYNDLLYSFFYTLMKWAQILKSERLDFHFWWCQLTSLCPEAGHLILVSFCFLIHKNGLIIPIFKGWFEGHVWDLADKDSLEISVFLCEWFQLESARVNCGLGSWTIEKLCIIMNHCHFSSDISGYSSFSS